MTNNRPTRIDVDDSTFLNYTPSSTSSSESNDSYSYTSYSISPMSHTSYSPERRRIPTANHIYNISNIVADVTPFEFNSIIEYDEESLALTDSTFTHSTTSFYNTVYFNKISYFITFLNIFLFFLFSIINNSKINSINPNNESLIFYSTTVYPYCEDIRDEIWRLFSYSFVHANLFHLFGNSIGIIVVTTNLYKFQSFISILLVYIVTVLNGALSFYLTNPYHALLGASGGVYGIAGSNLSNFIYNYDNMYDFEITFTIALYLIFSLIDIINYFAFYNDSIAYQVHWYCLLYGILFGLSTYRYKNVTRTKKWCRYISIFLFCYLSSFTIFNYIFNYPSKYSFNYFKIIKEESCCYDLLNNNKNTTFECEYLQESKFLY